VSGSLPSFKRELDVNNKGWTKPRILILEVRHPEQPDGKPVAWLLVERLESVEHDRSDGSIRRASICLSYQRIKPRGAQDVLSQGTFCGGYSKTPIEAVSLTSTSMGRGGVFLEPQALRGHRIGTYLMNEIVVWAKKWPEAQLHSIELSWGQGQDNNRERRNRFYEQFGIAFEYADEERRSGLSRPMPAKSLVPTDSWQANIVERPVFDYLADILYAEQTASFELQLRSAAIRDLVNERNAAYNHPGRWFLKTLYQKHAGLLAMIIFLCVLALIGMPQAYRWFRSF